MARRLSQIAVIVLSVLGGCDAFTVLGPNGCDELHPCTGTAVCDLPARRCVKAAEDMGSPPPEPRACRDHGDCPSLICDEFGAVGAPGLCVPTQVSATAGSSTELAALLPGTRGIRLRPGIFAGVWEVGGATIIVGPHADPGVRRERGPRAVLSPAHGTPVVRAHGQARLVLDGVTVSGGYGVAGHGILCESAAGALWLRRVEVSDNDGVGVLTLCQAHITHSIIGAWGRTAGNRNGGVQAEGELSIVNSFITGNGGARARIGGVLILPAQRQRKVLIAHLTFVGNRSAVRGAAADCSLTPGVHIWHSLLWENLAGPGGEGPIAGCILRAAAVDDPAYMEPVGVILSKERPPLFVSEGDYHLRPGSPALDYPPGVAGPVLPDDFDGEARPQGASSDYGADEVPAR